MQPFSAAVDTVFACFGVDAVYTPDGGGAVYVRVIVRCPDEIVGFGDTRILTETALFEVRASEVATPQSGDRLTVDGTDYVIQGEPERRDPDRLVWTLDVRPV
ncbi:MAG: hypothetical protein QF511_08245 [Rhodospirillales bacterium]|jgi:hypothetical protein|nr:hypothetical protein [Rhodospirillales bacterium]MDP7098486.1 hypothetical protein [Rhodospirillales bacterium]MDP7214885.1 hypothetical protein [Rhodospirillales bacterium]HIJ93095.1 hypothetical protein [Rhodospirillaceae bacterium]HJP53311.1 hypothetical protein [Rhodospirillales bacterium]